MLAWVEVDVQVASEVFAQHVILTTIGVIHVVPIVSKAEQVECDGEVLADVGGVVSAQADIVVLVSVEDILGLQDEFRIGFIQGDMQMVAELMHNHVVAVQSLPLAVVTSDVAIGPGGIAIAISGTVKSVSSVRPRRLRFQVISQPFALVQEATEAKRLLVPQHFAGS